jgi:hypothetical protein
MKKFLLLLLFAVATVGVNAQETESRTTTQKVVWQKNTSQYDKFLYDEVGGRPCDQVTIFIDRPGEDADQVLVSVKPITGWRVGIGAFGLYDAGDGKAGFGPGFNLRVGHSGHRWDFMSQMEVGYLTDPVNGSHYWAGGLFVVPTLNVAHWGRYDDKRLSLGLKLGLQANRTMDEMAYESGDISIKSQDKSLSFGPAAGLELSFEKRGFFKNPRWEVFVGAHLYDARYKAETSVNGIIVQDEKSNPLRLCAEAGFRVSFGLHHKTRDNFSGKYSVADTFVQ